MSAITSQTSGNETSTGYGFGWLIAAALALAPFALIGVGLARGGVEPYIVLAAWLLG